MRQDTLIYSVLIFVGIVAGFMIFWWMPKSPALGVVDMRLLISQRALAIAKPGIVLTSHQLKDMSQHLKDELNNLAREKNMILLAKGVIAGGELPDYTDAALSIAEKGERP